MVKWTKSFSPESINQLCEFGQFDFENKNYERALTQFCKAIDKGFTYYGQKEPGRDIDWRVFIRIFPCIRELELYLIKTENQLRQTNLEIILNTFLSLNKRLNVEDFPSIGDFILFQFSIANLFYQKTLAQKDEDLLKMAKDIFETESLIDLIKRSQDYELIEKIRRESLNKVTDHLIDTYIIEPGAETFSPEIKSLLKSLNSAPQNIQKMILETLPTVTDDQQRIILLNQVIQSYPTYSVLYYLRGVSYMELQNYQSAQRDFDSAIKYDPENIEAYYARAGLNGMLGKLQEIIVDMDKAINIKPDDGRLYYLRGMTYREIGKLQEYMQDIQRSAQLGDQNAQQEILSQ